MYIAKATMCILLLCSCAVHLKAASVIQEKPNVLFIVIDDLNDVPKFMGVNPDAKTPNMDTLAASGTVFKNAHCSYPLCGPSRASFLSGMRPTTMGFQGHMEYSELRSRTDSLGGTLIHQHFKNNGYQVFAAGKIHHKGVPDDYVDVAGADGYFGAKEGINYYHTATSTDWGVPSYGGSDANFSDKACADFAVARLGETHTDPFLLMVGFVQPHVPWYTPQPYFDLYPDSSALTLARYEPDDFDDISAESEGRSLYPQYPRTADMITQGQRGNIMQAYLACVSFTDHYLGQVLIALKNSPYADNTIIVLFSDHGYHLGEKNTYQKETLWERSSHVPMIVVGPGIGVQQVAGPIVSLLDIYPTLIDLCGLSENPMIEGQSLRPLLENPAADWDHPAVTSFLGNNHAVQMRQFRYISWSEGSEELYDHFADPDEITNLAANPAYATVKNELKKHLPTNMRSTGFRTRFDVNAGTATGYVANMFTTGGVQLYDQPLSNTTTAVEGMQVSSGASSATVTLQVTPASAFGVWRAANFSPRDQRDLSTSGSEAEGVLFDYAMGTETNASISVETDTAPKLSFNQYASRNDIDIHIGIADSLTNTSWTSIANSLAGAPTMAMNGSSVSQSGSEPVLVELTAPGHMAGESQGFFKVRVDPLF
jgi:arylsulfatase A-like enzyme